MQIKLYRNITNVGVAGEIVTLDESDSNQKAYIDSILKNRYGEEYVDVQALKQQVAAMTAKTTPAVAAPVKEIDIAETADETHESAPIDIRNMQRFELLKLAKEKGIAVLPTDKKEDLLLKLKDLV